MTLVNEVLKNEFHERKNHDKKRAFTTASFNTQRIFKFLDPERYRKQANHQNNMGSTHHITPPSIQIGFPKLELIESNGIFHG